MADKRDSQLPPTTDVVGLIIPVLLPDVPSPTGYENYIITIEALQAGLQSQIDDNETDIIDHELRIDDLEDINKVDRSLNFSGTGNITLPENGVITSIDITVVTGTTVNVEVGTTTPNGSELADYAGVKALGANEFKSKDIIHRNTLSGGNSPSQPIYYTVTGGTVHIHLFYKVLSTT